MPKSIVCGLELLVSDTNGPCQDHANELPCPVLFSFTLKVLRAEHSQHDYPTMTYH